MYYHSLHISQIRSYRDYAIELSPSVNIVVGPNASGKTNLLEAILMVSRGRSFRAKDADIVMHGQDWGRIAAQSEGQSRELRLQRKNEFENYTRTLRVDDTEVKRISARHMAPVTLFEPEHLRMIHGGPERRRDYIDTVLEIIEPGYKQALTQYRRALAQRNKLLKLPRTPLADELFVWNVRLSDYGSRIAQARIALVERLNARASEMYQGLSGVTDARLEVGYAASVPGADYGSRFLKLLEANFETDRLRGFTGIGPHRDDLEFTLNGHAASAAASRGETRTIVLVCKILELQLLEETVQDKPILLLDDVFSELDSTRRKALTDYLQAYQTIITTTDADSIVQHFLGDVSVIPTAIEQ